MSSMFATKKNLWKARAKEAEAKLEKAMSALEKVQTFVKDLEPYAEQGHTLVPALRDACLTYNELKGENIEV